MKSWRAVGFGILVALVVGPLRLPSQRVRTSQHPYGFTRSNTPLPTRASTQERQVIRRAIWLTFHNAVFGPKNAKTVGASYQGDCIRISQAGGLGNAGG